MPYALFFTPFSARTANRANSQPWLATNAGSLLVGVAIVVVLLLILVGLGATRNPQTRKLRFGIRSLIGGADNRLSTSKTLVMAWTVVVAWMLISEAIRDFAANVPLGSLAVSDDYLLLLGGPFAAAVLAKQIVTTRLTNGTLIKPSAPPDAPLQLSDLIAADDGSPDLVDFQYSLFNLIALGIVVYTFIQHPALGLPAVPSGLLAVTSASAATYVGNKAVASSTPAIARFAPGQVRIGQVTTISGSNLMASAASAVGTNFPVITIGGVPAAVVGTPSASSVTVRVPRGVATVPGGQQAPVTLVADPTGAASADSDVMVVPDSVQITDVTPSAPPVGTTVVLNGSGFVDASAMPPADPDVPFDTPVVVIQTADTGDVLVRIPVDQNNVVNRAPAPPSDSKLTIEMPKLNVKALTPLQISVTRGALTSAPVPMLLGSGPTVPVPPSDLATPRVVDGGTGLDYGSGVCTLNGVMRGSALTFQAPAGPPAFTGTTKITLCTTRDEVYQALDITADTEASYGLASVSSKFSWAQSQDTVSTSLHLVVRSAMASAPLALTGPTLSADARSLLQVGDFVSFFQRYGDRFVSARVVGGEYVALLSIYTLHQADLQTISEALDASVSAGELDVSVQTSVTQTLNQFQDDMTMTFSEFHQGGDIAAAATTGGAGGGELDAETVMGTAIAFPGTVTTANAFPLQAVLSDYTEVALPDPQGWLDFQAAQLLPARSILLQIEAVIQGLQSDLDQVQYILAHPELFEESEAVLQQQFAPLETSLGNQISAATQLAVNYASSVMAQGQASAIQAPPIPQRAPIAWPVSKPVPTYRILLANPRSGTEWAVCCPTGGDPTGPLALQPGDPGNLGQQFQIPQVTEVSFTMTNVRTGLMATWTGTGKAVTQTPGNGSQVSWTTTSELPILFENPLGPGEVLLRPLAQGAQSDEWLNLWTDHEQAGEQIITYAEFPPTHASVWKLEPVPVPGPTVPPQFGVKIAVPAAW